MTFQKSAFLNNLRFWGLHCTLTAFPSFLVAGIFLELFSAPAAILAMMAGVLIFIFGYSFLSTLHPLLRAKDSLFSRALNLAIKIRVVISILGFIGVFLPFIMFYHPDFWAGVFAGQFLEAICRTIGLNISFPGSRTFLPILLWTLTEGIILSFLLFLIAFFCLLVMKARKSSSPR